MKMITNRNFEIYFFLNFFLLIINNNWEIFLKNIFIKNYEYNIKANRNF